MKPKIILDSGAYSVWRRGNEIDLEKYIDFCLEYNEWIWQVVALDVIPGSPGIARTPAQVEQAAVESAKNTTRMMERGVSVMPVFHQGERFYWLEKMLQEGHTYIGLAPNKSVSSKMKVPWLDSCFNLLCSGGRYPSVKLHAFGEASWGILTRFPWYSADSTSWLLLGANGKVYVPSWSDELGDYHGEADPFRVPVSGGLGGVSSQSALVFGRDFRTMGVSNRKYLGSYIRSMGFTKKQLAEDDKARKRLNLRYFQAYAELYRQKPYWAKTRGFFDREGQNWGVSEWKFGEGIKFAFVTGVSRHNLWMVSKEECEFQLISYADILNNSYFRLDWYVDGELCLKRVGKKRRIKKRVRL